MANEEKFGKNDVLLKRIPGETVNNEPAFAMAIFDAGIPGIGDIFAAEALPSGGVNYAVTSDMISTPPQYAGVYLLWDVYTLPVSGTITLFVDIRNPVDGDYSALYQTPTIPATGSVAALRKYLLYPGAVDDGAQLTGVDRLPIPREWRFRVNTGGGSGTWGYSVGYQFV